MLESILKRFTTCGWQHVIGTSGTIKAIFSWARIGNPTLEYIDVTHLYQLRDDLIALGHIDAIEIEGIKEQRQPIICAGLSILIAIVEMLKIKSLSFCDYSLREGVLFEQLDLLHYQDIRDRSVNSMALRFSVDKPHADETGDIANDFYQQVACDWDIDKRIYKKLLFWSAQLHEIGMDINASGFHKHGQYILEHADLAGFSQELQAALAWLVGSQRKRIKPHFTDFIQVLSEKRLVKTLALLRLALRLNQQRQLTDIPNIKLTAHANQLTIQIDHEWLENKPLIVADIEEEVAIFSPFDLEIILVPDVTNNSD